MSQKEEFLKEFKALLEKYDAGISFDVGSGSDTHGLNGERMLVEHRVSKDSFREETWLEVSGWCIWHYDIEV